MRAITDGPIYMGDDGNGDGGFTLPQLIPNAAPPDTTYVQPPTAPPPPQPGQYPYNNVAQLNYAEGPDYDAYGNIIDWSTYSGPALIDVTETDPKTGGSLQNRWLLGSTQAYQMMLAGTIAAGRVWIPADFGVAAPVYTPVSAAPIPAYYPPTPAPNPYPQQPVTQTPNPYAPAPATPAAPVINTAPVYVPNPVIPAPTITPIAPAPAPIPSIPAPVVQLPLPAPIASDVPTAPIKTPMIITPLPMTLYPDLPPVNDGSAQPQTSSKSWLLWLIAGAALLSN